MECFILCPGPSLTAEDCERIRSWQWVDRIVIAVNLAWESAPWADILYAGDAPFWEHDPYREAINAGFHGMRYTASTKAAKRYGLRLLKRPKLSNSGANAIQLAYQLGAKRIFILGMDYSKLDGKLHCHEDHAIIDAEGKSTNLYNTDIFDTDQIAALAVELRLNGVDVINCSRHSALKCFERVELEMVV